MDHLAGRHNWMDDGIGHVAAAGRVVVDNDFSVMTMTAEPAGISKVNSVLPLSVNERAMEEGGAPVPESNVPMWLPFNVKTPVRPS